MAALPGPRDGLNTQPLFIAYSKEDRGELRRVEFGDEAAGILSVELDSTDNFYIEVTGSESGLPKRIQSIFIENIGPGTNNPIQPGEYNRFERCQILDQLHESFDESKPEPSMHLFLTFNNSNPVLTIQRRVVQKVDDLQESDQESILIVDGKIRKLFEDQSFWFFSVGEECEGRQSNFSIFMKDGKLQFQLTNSHGTNVPVTLVPLEYTSKSSGTEKQYDLRQLSREDQNIIFNDIKSEKIIIGLLENRPGFNLFFSITDEGISEEVRNVLDRATPLQIREESFNHNSRPRRIF